MKDEFPECHNNLAMALLVAGRFDTLQFCRYAPLAVGKGLHVILLVQSELVRLMKSLSGIEQVIALGQLLSDFDYYCPTMSLPAAFNTRVETVF